MVFSNAASIHHCIWITNFGFILFQIVPRHLIFQTLTVSNGNANINLSLQLSATGFACPAQLCSCCVHEILQTGPLGFISQDTTLIQGLHFQPVFLILFSLFLLTLKQEIRLKFFDLYQAVQCEIALFQDKFGNYKMFLWKATQFCINLEGDGYSCHRKHVFIMY